MEWFAWRKLGWGGVVWIGLNLACNYNVAADPNLKATPSAGTEAYQATEPSSKADTPEKEPIDSAQDVVSQDQDQPPGTTEVEAPPAEATQPLEASPESEAVAPAGETAPQTVEQDLGAETIPSKTRLTEQQPIPEGSPPAIDGKPSKFKAFLGDIETAFSLTSGIRRDNFRWSIAGDSSGSNPNILSELTWTDVDSYQLTLTNRSFYKRNVYFRGEINYAFVQSGDIRDSDYRENDRQDEYSRSKSESSGDQLWDLSLAGGYPFFFLQDRLMVAPLYGLSYHKQNFRITNGRQVITSGSLPPIGPLAGLNSTYRSAWYGPWLGVDMRYHIKGDKTKGILPMELGLSFELHYADYEAEANWNLRQDLKHPTSFEHEDTGLGIVLSGEWIIDLTRRWSAVLRSTYQSWKTSEGVDRVHNSDGTVDKTRLNEVEWRNVSLMLGANFQF